jgi:hypothetical protein
MLLLKCTFEFAGVVFEDYLPGDTAVSDVIRLVEQKVHAPGVALTSRIGGVVGPRGLLQEC